MPEKRHYVGLFIALALSWGAFGSSYIQCDRGQKRFAEDDLLMSIPSILMLSGVSALTVGGLGYVLKSSCKKLTTCGGGGSGCNKLQRDVGEGCFLTAEFVVALCVMFGPLLMITGSILVIVDNRGSATCRSSPAPLICVGFALVVVPSVVFMKGSYWPDADLPPVRCDGGGGGGGGGGGDDSGDDSGGGGAQQSKPHSDTGLAEAPHRCRDSAPTTTAATTTAVEGNVPKQSSSEPTAAASSAPRLCCICLSGPSDHAFVPCFHLCACEGCSRVVMNTSKKCPVCAEHAESAKRVYDASFTPSVVVRE